MKQKGQKMPEKWVYHAWGFPVTTGSSRFAEGSCLPTIYSHMIFRGVERDIVPEGLRRGAYYQ